MIHLIGMIVEASVGMNWLEQTLDSQYETVVALQHTLDAGDIEEARKGLEALRDAMSRSEKRVLRSQLIRLMLHVLKWKTQPQRRSRSWAGSIVQARHAIEDIQTEIPSLNRVYIEQVWDYCLQRAMREAEAEMGVQPVTSSLTWQEVFVDTYAINTNDG